MFHDYRFNQNDTIILSRAEYDRMLELVDDGFYRTKGHFPIGYNIICISEYPTKKPKTPDEIIKSKKNKKQFYKKLDRLKKWEQ
jgi:hypothetical protein